MARVSSNLISDTRKVGNLAVTDLFVFVSLLSSYPLRGAACLPYSMRNPDTGKGEYCNRPLSGPRIGVQGDTVLDAVSGNIRRNVSGEACTF